MKEELNKRRMNECASEEMAGQVGKGKNRRSNPPPHEQAHNTHAQQ